MRGTSGARAAGRAPRERGRLARGGRRAIPWSARGRDLRAPEDASRRGPLDRGDGPSIRCLVPCMRLRSATGSTPGRPRPGPLDRVRAGCGIRGVGRPVEMRRSILLQHPHFNMPCAVVRDRFILIGPPPRMRTRRSEGTVPVPGVLVSRRRGRRGERPLEDVPWELGPLLVLFDVRLRLPGRLLGAWASCPRGLGCAARRSPCGRGARTPGKPIALIRPRPASGRIRRGAGGEMRGPCRGLIPRPARRESGVCRGSGNRSGEAKRGRSALDCR